MILRILLVISISTLAACNWRNQDNRPLDRQSFVSLHADLTATLWKAKRVTADSTALARVADSVIAAHGVTRQRYELTYSWYNADPERWKGFFDEVGKVLEERARQEATRR